MLYFIRSKGRKNKLIYAEDKIDFFIQFQTVQKCRFVPELVKNVLDNWKIQTNVFQNRILSEVIKWHHMLRREPPKERTEQRTEQLPVSFIPPGTVCLLATNMHVFRPRRRSYLIEFE